MEMTLPIHHDDDKEMGKALPLVSIVTPVFNGEKWMENCIRSVSDQDYPNIEHIVVDGGSTDGTPAICRRHPHLILSSKENRGLSHAVNRGFAMAQGEILTWLCPEDEYAPGAVSAAVEAIRDGHEVVVGRSRFIDAGGNVMADHPADGRLQYGHAEMVRFWKYPPLCQPAVFWSRRMWERWGPLKENLFRAPDYDLWLAMSRQTAFARLDGDVARYRLCPERKGRGGDALRRELLEVSRRYWPSFWRPLFWELSFGYRFSASPLTSHYGEAMRLVREASQCLDSADPWRALKCCLKAHVRHPATPALPGYGRVAWRLVRTFLGHSLSGRIKTLVQRNPYVF